VWVAYKNATADAFHSVYFSDIKSKHCSNALRDSSVCISVSKLRPAGQIRPAKPFHPLHEAILSMMKKIMLKKKLRNVLMINLFIW